MSRSPRGGATRKWTGTGRVVYDRKPHLYDIKDFRRIFKAIFRRSNFVGDLNFYLDVILAVALEGGISRLEVVRQTLNWLEEKFLELGGSFVDYLWDLFFSDKEK